jgi:hypothetical protein
MKHFPNRTGVFQRIRLSVMELTPPLGCGLSARPLALPDLQDRAFGAQDSKLSKNKSKSDYTHAFGNIDAKTNTRLSLQNPGDFTVRQKFTVWFCSNRCACLLKHRLQQSVFVGS